MNYRFIFDPQNGSYQGVARSPFPENCTPVQPHFSVGYKTCWDFSNRWKLVKESEFFEQVRVQDVLRAYDVDLDSKNKIMMQNIEDRLSELMRRQNENHMLSWGASRAIEHVFNNRLDEIEKHLDGLQMDLIIVQDRLELIIDLLTMGPLKRYLRRLKAWILRREV